jgi:antagonist of KipI
MTMLGPRLRILAPATIAVTGADLGARIDDRPMPRWESVVVEPGNVLSFPGPRDGLRAYLAVTGGIDVPVVLGSRSTYTRSKLGGVDGRPVRAGDALHVAAPRPVLLGGALRLPTSNQPTYGHVHRLRVVPGPQDDRFTADGIRTFLSATFVVTPQSDRMGCRLAGPAIEHVRGADIVSDGTPFGAVQVAGDGAPIVLLADRGTAGGYTKIATVIGPDIPQLAQAAPGDTVTFTDVTLDEAYAAVRQEESLLASIGPVRREGRASRLKAVAAAVAAVASVR